MATLYIEEYSELAVANFGHVAACPKTPAVASQTVSIGGASAQSNPFAPSTHFILVHTDAICSVNIGGTNPTATTSNMRLPQNETRFYGVVPGDRLAVISNV